MRNNKTKKNNKVVLFNENDYNSDNGMLILYGDLVYGIVYTL